MKTKKKSLIKKCDDILSLIIRSNGYCEVCGKSSYICQLHAHHIVTRKIMVLRYDLRNLVCLCAGCHKLNKFSAHENSLWFIDWLTEHRPEDLEYVKSKSNSIAHYTEADLR